MVERDTTDARVALGTASRARQQVRDATRWFTIYMLTLGILAFAFIIALEAFDPLTITRLGAGAVWAISMILIGRWAESHDVHPEGAKRRVWIAFGLWFGGYLFVLGPIVRWQAGDSLLWWSLASLVLASPFLIGALREWRRR